MRCHICRKGSKVIQTKADIRGGEYVIVRRRKCSNGHSFTTDEKIRVLVDFISKDEGDRLNFLLEKPRSSNELMAQWKLSEARCLKIREALMRKHLRSDGLTKELVSEPFASWTDEQIAERWRMTVRGVKAVRTRVLKSHREQNGTLLQEIWASPGTPRPESVSTDFGTASQVGGVLPR